jgi:hypothetical protein
MLQAALAASLALIVYFSGRAAYRFYRLKMDYNEPVGPWMSIGYAARANKISPADLHNALGFTPGGKPERGPLGEIAKRHGYDVKTFMEKVNVEVSRLKAEKALETSPAPAN